MQATDWLLKSAACHFLIYFKTLMWRLSVEGLAAVQMYFLLHVFEQNSPFYPIRSFQLSLLD